MPLKGVVCPLDSSYREFGECICGHENGTRTCHAPIQLLKLMRDNHIDRKDAGWSASMLTNCPRANAIQETYDYYEDPQSGWNKARGTFVHLLMESDQTPRDGLIRERRLRKAITVDEMEVFLTGKPDEVDTINGVLIDYKSKDLLPKRPDPNHEAQFNVYAWLLNGGTFMDTGEISDTIITSGGMHYLTWRTKDAFKKMAYPLWGDAVTEEFITTRLRPLVEWKKSGELPTCNPYIRFPGNWRCSCVRLEEQLRERGVDIG